jgi:hypothetical protein
MFNLPYIEKVEAWRNFRLSLETTADPIQAVIDFADSAPLVERDVNPWNQQEFPTPWELLQQNRYTDFCRILLICYTLQLTDRFTTDNFEIHICTDTDSSEQMYLLRVGNLIIGYDNSCAILDKDLPDTVISHRIYVMPTLQ